MKVEILYFIEAEKIPAGLKRQRPSKGFDKAWKMQVFDKIREKIEPLFPVGSLKINQTKLMSFSTEGGEVIGAIKGNDVLFDGFLSLFDFDIFWKDIVDGSRVLPTDEIQSDRLLFWVERFPSEQELRRMREQFEHQVQLVLKREKSGSRKYRFPVKILEMGESMRFIVETSDSETTVEEVLEVGILEWNTANPDRLIHNFYFLGKKRNNLSFLFNWGSATEETLDFLLEKINASSLDIRKIRIGD